MKVKYFEFDVTDFEEVYVIIDDERNRIHISPVNYEYNITLDLNNIYEDLKNYTRYGERNFIERVREVCKKIMEELDL